MVKKKRHSPLYLQIAEKLKAEIAADPPDSLPSADILAGRYSISFNTMHKVLHTLQEQNVLVVRNGKKAEISSHFYRKCGKKPPVGTTAMSRFADKIRDAITSGNLKSGEVLPKYQDYIGREHISARIIVGAFNMLKNEGLLHKSLNRWIVGPRPEIQKVKAEANNYFRDVPVVLCAIPGNFLTPYQHFFQSFYRSFFSTFFNEIEKSGMNIQAFHLQKNDSLPGIIPCGPDEIRELIRKLGSRYRGTLFHLSRHYKQDIEKLLPLLAWYQKPVIIYDDWGLVKNILNDLRKKGYHNCRRYCLVERIPLTLAIETLSSRGHTRIGFLAPLDASRDQWWVRSRAKKLQDLYRTRRRESIRVIHLHEDLWVKILQKEENLLSNLFARKKLNELSGEYPGASIMELWDIFLRDLLSDLSPVIECIRRKEITAIIAPNQMFAVNVKICLEHSGIKIPDDISIITFDNELELIGYPITTIDFNLEDLAYKTAQAFISAIPIKNGRHGEITSMPKLIDRGSVGIPKSFP